MADPIAWEFDPQMKRLTIEFDRKSDYAFLGRAQRSKLQIRAHEIGLHVKFDGRYYYNDTYTIPGDYPLEDVARFIGDKFGREYGDTFDPRVYVSDLLLETELWYQRGKLANPKTFPPEIFEKIPLEQFIKGGLKNYKQWMHEVVYGDRRIFQGINKERVERLIAQGEYPERVHSMRNWKVLSFDDIKRAIRHKAWHHPKWGVFTSQYYPTFGGVLSRHPEAWEEIDAFISACIKFPKTDRTQALFDEVYVLGGTLKRAERFTHIRDLVAYRDMLAERAADVKEHKTLYHYKPPMVALPKGWLWANGKTFWTLGEKYNCCINNNGYYSNALSNELAAVAYRDSMEGGGALAFFTRHVGSHEWYVREIRGWSNRPTAKSYESQANEIAADMTAASLQEKLAHEAELEQIRKYSGYERARAAGARR